MIGLLKQQKADARQNPLQHEDKVLDGVFLRNPGEKICKCEK